MKALRLKEIQERKSDKCSLREVLVDLYLGIYLELTEEECFEKLAYLSDLELLKLIINQYYNFYERSK